MQLLGVVIAAAAAVIAAAQDTRPDWQPRFLGQTPLRHAAFMEMYFSEDETLEYEDRWSMYVSRFDPGTVGQYDEKYYMRSPGRYLDSIESWATDNIQVLDVTAYWPNNPDYLPSSVAGAEGIIWTSGFLVPGKTDGQLQMYDTTQEPPVGPFNIASNDSIDWAYHKVVWKDMDNDGDLDALTARFFLPTVGDTLHDILYYENTGQGFSEGWTEHIISSVGPDVHFAPVTLTVGLRDYDCIVVGEFFNQQLSILWTDSPDNDWSDPSMVNYRVINADAGQTFDTVIDDYNRDGILEILSTEYKTDIGEGQVTVYFFPPDFRTDEFESVVIADGFIPHNIVGGESMSPGTPKPYYPSTAYANELGDDGLPHKPWILLSGDDDGRMYILYPDTEARDDWTYRKNILLDTMDTTIGKMAHGDVDNDGYEEIIVAGYSVGQLYVYTYAP
jgi:hypothetical protein